MRSDDPNFKLRLPPEVHDHLKRKSRQQERTMGAHIVFLLRQEMQKEAPGPSLATNPDASQQ